MADAPDDELSTTLGRLPEVRESLLILDRALGGDSGAFGELLMRYEDRVRRIVHIRTGARLRRLVQVDDLVQDVYARALAGIDRYRPRDGAEIIGWLVRVAESVIADEARYWNRAKRDPERVASFEGDSGDAIGLPAPGSSPSSAVGNEELAKLLDDAVESLEPPDYREVILLRDYQGGDWRYVQETLGRESLKAVQEMHRRARIKLAAMLEKRLGR